MGHRGFAYDALVLKLCFELLWGFDPNIAWLGRSRLPPVPRDFAALLEQRDLIKAVVEVENGDAV